jgi:hypothetical protein
LLVALGVAALDTATAGHPTVERARSPWRVAAVVMAAFTGLGLRALVPTHAVASYSIETIPITGFMTTGGAQATQGEILATTACGLVEESAEGTGAKVRCDAPKGMTPGLARLRVETATEARTISAVERANSRLERSLPSFSAQWPAPIDVGQPTWAYTAPVWVPLSALAGAILVPARRRRGGEVEASVASLGA